MKNINILIVDDDEDDFFLISDLLKDLPEHSFHFTWAKSFDDGLKEIKQKDLDICLIDYLLGTKTGLDLLKTIRATGNETPIIMLTGRGNKEVDREALLFGATDYLVKSDLETEGLGRSIRYAIAHGRALRAARDNERRYRHIFNSSKDMIYLAYAGKNVFIDVNDRATEIFGYTREELLNIDAAQLLAEPSQADEIVAFLLTNKEIRDVEVNLVTKSGESRICILNSLLYTEGGATYHHGSVQDVTLLRQMERNRMNMEKLAATGRFTRALAHEVRNPLTN